MTGVFPSHSDIGNRITELNKVVLRMHGDLKVVQQILMDDGQGANDATKDGSSVLGKYIMGAKNNFRGFQAKQGDKNAPLKVTVHHREEDVDKDVESGVEPGSEYGGRGSESEVVRMEEGRVQSKLGVNEGTESREEVEADRKKGYEVKEEVGADASSFHTEVKSEPPPDQTNGPGKIPAGTAGGEKWTERSSGQAEGTSKGPDTMCTVNRFKDIELQEKSKQAQWEKGRKAEQSIALKSDGDTRPKNNVPSPTGSSSSQDTGFGSREGEGSIDGVGVKR